MAASGPPRLADILDDLASRFIINCPVEELESFDRLLFQIEAAWWFFEDFYREQHAGLPSFNLRDFAEQMFKHCPVLQPYHKWIQQIYTSFTNYKTRVPVCGAIMLNPTLDKCVLVKGWSAKASWTFPKGKVNKDEPEIDCAAREVFEETGYDLKGWLREEDSVEVTMREQRSRMFIVGGIPEDSVFVPQTRKEISRVEWHRVDDLPTYTNKAGANYNGNHYWMVMPYMRALKGWISNRRKQLAAQNASGKGRRGRKGQQQQPQAQQQYSAPIDNGASSSSGGTGSFDFNAFAAAIPYPGQPHPASSFHSAPVSVPQRSYPGGYPPSYLQGPPSSQPYSTSLPSPSSAPLAQAPLPGMHPAPSPPPQFPTPLPPPQFPTPLQAPPPYVPGHAPRPNSFSELSSAASPASHLTRVPLSALFGPGHDAPKGTPSRSRSRSRRRRRRRGPTPRTSPAPQGPGLLRLGAGRGRGAREPLLNFSFNTLELLECLELDAGPKRP
eukprot:tig00000385_g24735.t1